MDPTLATNVYLNLVICLMALALHVTSKWELARKQAPSKEERPSLLEYLSDIPAQVSTVGISAALMFLVTYAMGWMNPVASLAAGYIPNSAVDNVVKHWEKMAANRTP